MKSLKARPSPPEAKSLLFPVLATPYGDPTKNTWNVTIHGWSFKLPLDSTITQAKLKLLRKALRLEGPPGSSFNERAMYFLAENQEKKKFKIQILKETNTSPLSGANGHFFLKTKFETSSMARSPIPIKVFETPNPHDRMGRSDLQSELAGGSVFLVPDSEGLSVISDIDDTIRNSQVFDSKLLLSNTFDKPFEAVPSTLKRLHLYQIQGATFHYVSATPWQLYPSLQEFWDTAQIPVGTFHLKDFRWKDKTFFNLFKSPLEYKIGKIKPLLSQFKNRRFILIGDSGESDLEAYTELACQFPKNIERIVIRKLERSKIHTQEAFDGAVQESFKKLKKHSIQLELF